VSQSVQNWVLFLLRLTLGWTFLWAFLDKLFGLGFATCRGEDGVVVQGCEKAFLNGGSVTTGFLKFGSTGPFAPLFQGMAGNVIVEWLFIVGLGAIGISLILGIGIKIAGYSGALLMLLMYLAVLPKANNPFMDDHIIYAIVLIGLAHSKAGQFIGLGKFWANTPIVKSLKFLE